MMPVLLVSSNKEFIDAYVDRKAKELKIPQSDIAHIEPESTVISIEQIRDAGILARKSGGPRILVLHDFSTARKESQNAFLKALEESERCLIILCVEDESQVLSTIQSRTITVREVNGGASHEKIAHSDIHTAATYEEWLSASAKLDKQKALTVMSQTIHLLRARLHSDTQKSMPAKALSECLIISNIVQKNNLNHEYALDRIGHILSDNALLPLVE